LVAVAVARSLATIAVLVALYYLLPLDRSVDAVTLLGLTLGIVVLLAVVAFQVRAIIRSDQPTLRATEALAFTVPLYILLFATTHFLMNHAQPTNFGVSLSRTDAMYFSATVFTTVGFGDITAKSEAARLVVTAQMMLDLVIIGFVVKLILNAVKLSQQRHTT
jgi:hypothetical protein